MSIENQITRINTNIAAAYTAANGKGATMPQAQNSANLAATINSISGDQQVNKEDKDVNFFDYDGTVLYTYTADEFCALTELPPLPQHEGLVANGWTYTIAKIIDYLDDGQTVDVGIYYETDNGNTRLHLLVENSDALPSELPLYVKIRNGTLDISVNGVQNVSETESANSETNHTIAVSLPTPTSFPAKYTIDISFTGDGYYAIGQNSVSSAIFGDSPLRIGLLESAEIGSRCRITTNSFYNYYNMKSVVLPSSITKLENYTFYGCSALKSVVVPEQLTDLGEQTFRNCVALKRVVLSKSITAIKYCDFYNCVSLRQIIIPETVNTCGSYVFYYCTSLKKLKLSGITSMGTMLFSNCFSLESVVSDGCTTLNANIFADCVSLREIKISGVQSISAYAFSGCLKLFSFDLTAYTDPTVIPTLAATNALQNTPTTQKIYVSSQTMLEAFSITTNWSTYASRFEVKPIVYDQRNDTVKMYLDSDPDYTDYPETVGQDNAYNISYFLSKYKSVTSDDSKPSGISVTLPSDGALEIHDGAKSMSYSVSAGEHKIYNITPGNTGSFILKDSNDQVVSTGLLKPTKTYHHPLRMIYCKLTSNVRDLGGWACDGGTVKYGKLFRGAKLFSGATGGTYQNDINFDKSVLHDLLGIRHELDLREESQRDGLRIGDDVTVTEVPGTMYVINDSATYDNVHTRYAKMLNCVIDCASGANPKPLYFHCTQGADRTGLLAMLIEAILGVSPSDIDKDYEMTTFYLGNDSGTTPGESAKNARRRDESAWHSLMFGSVDGAGNTVNGIYSLDNNGDPVYPGDNLRDKVISWALSLVPEEGTAKITIDRLNAFRAAMIDGAPDVIGGDANAD